MMVMEYVRFTLLDLLNGEHRKTSDFEKPEMKGLSLKKARRIMSGVIHAVEHVHRANLIHRDIKPENILCSADGSVAKLCDFGLSRVSAHPQTDLMNNNRTPFTDYVATRWYRSPELLVGGRAYTSSVDIWALACLWVEMLTARPLFGADSELHMLWLIVKACGPLPFKFVEMYQMAHGKTVKMQSAQAPDFLGLLHAEFGLKGSLADIVIVNLILSEPVCVILKSSPPL